VSKKKTISIDYWGTLYKSSLFFSREIYSELISCGFLENITYEIFKEKKKILKTHVNYITERTGVQIPTMTLFKVLAKELNISEDKITDLDLRYQRRAYYYPPVLIDENYKNLLGRLALRYKLVISCNAMLIDNAVLHAVMVKDSIEKYFDGFFFSDALGLAKPCKEMYGGSHYHIGDTKTTDYDGPKAHGIIPFLITPTNTFEDICETLLMLK
jgi:FMN phosphatase YigB (HAD superfamily)